MTTALGDIKNVATAYAEAWLAGDAEKALSFIADDILCEAPSGPVKGIAAYREFLTPFCQSVTNAELLELFVDGDHAGEFYRVDTPVAKNYFGAEHLTVSNGKISHIVSIFDMAPMMKAQAANQGN